MKHCTGILGRQCSCGMWHGNGGMTVERGIQFDHAEDDSDFLKQENAMTALLRFGAIPTLIGLVALFALSAAIFA